MHLTKDTIRGTWGTVLLPVTADDSIDWNRLQAEVDVLVHSGLDGVYTNGTAAEFYSQTTDEFDRICAMVATACHEADLPFQLGVSHPSPSTSLQRLQRATPWRPGAFQVILPDWSPVSIAEAIGFLERMANEAAPIPLVVYNPPQAKRVLSPEEWGQIIRAVPAVVGIKVLGGDAAWFEAMHQHAPGLSIFVAGHSLASSLQLGAQGSYSNMACMQPRAAAAWWAMMQDDLPRALELESRILAFFRDWISPRLGPEGHSNQAADKLLAAIGGWADIGTRLRWPYRGFAPSDVTALRARALEYIPEFHPDHVLRYPG